MIELNKEDGKVQALCKLPLQPSNSHLKLLPSIHDQTTLKDKDEQLFEENPSEIVFNRKKTIRKWGAMVVEKKRKKKQLPIQSEYDDQCTGSQHNVLQQIQQLNPEPFFPNKVQKVSHP